MSYQIDNVLLIDLFNCIKMNEIGSNDSLAYKFSDPDGVNSGKSGYSFGMSQFDIENNWDAIIGLKKAGFKPKDVKRLFCQNTNISDLNAKLLENKSVIDEMDVHHLETSANHCDRLCVKSNIEFVNNEAFIHLVDYHNQMYMSPNGKIHRYLASLDVPVTSDHILDFKLNQTSWGKRRPDDVQRRYNNIVRHFAKK